MSKLLQSRIVSVYNCSNFLLGTVRASMFNAQTLGGLIDESDLQECINLLNRPKCRNLTVYDKLSGLPVRFYRL
jgi:hypothetical protein